MAVHSDCWHWLHCHCTKGVDHWVLHPLVDTGQSLLDFLGREDLRWSRCVHCRQEVGTHVLVRWHCCCLSASWWKVRLQIRAHVLRNGAVSSCSCIAWFEFQYSNSSFNVHRSDCNNYHEINQQIIDQVEKQNKTEAKQACNKCSCHLLIFIFLINEKWHNSAFSDVFRLVCDFENGIEMIIMYTFKNLVAKKTQREIYF